MTTLISELIDDVEPILTIKDGTQVFEVMLPEDLPEAEYLLFNEAQAEMVEAFLETKQEGITRVEYAQAEGRILRSTRKWVEALAQMPVGYLAKRRSATVTKLYSDIEAALGARRSAEQPKGEAPVGETPQPQENV